MSLSRGMAERNQEQLLKIEVFLKEMSKLLSEKAMEGLLLIISKDYPGLLKWRLTLK